MQRNTSLRLLLILIILIAPQAFHQALAQVNLTLQSGALTLEDGTPLKLRISRTVSSADAHVGDTVDFDVLEEVTVGGLVVIPKAGVAWGTVTEAESKRRMARGGKLNMNIDSVRLLDGEKVALRAVKEMKGGGHTGAMTGGIVATAIVFWPAAPFFLFMHGKDIVIPKGTEITAYINGNFPFDAAKFRNASQSNQATSAQATPSPANGADNIRAESAALEISSTPTNGDIELDGNFAGNTPSSLGISAGEHTLRISKQGYKSWERKLRSSTGTVRLAAELEPISATAVAPSLSMTTASVANTTVSPTNVAKPHVEETIKPLTSSAAVLDTAASKVKPAALISRDETPAVQAMTPSSSGENDGTASVTSIPDRADIFVDSVGHGHTPALLKLTPGKHRVQLVLQGYKDSLIDVEVEADSIVNVTGKLER
jgi:PEGA domain-containing protein